MKTLHIDYTPKFSFNSYTFSLLSREGNTVKALLPFVSCRSYMCDNLLKLKLPKYASKPCYPFDYNYKSGDIYVGIKLASENQKQTFINNISKLHEIETKAKVKKSVVYKTNENLILVVEGSKFWKDSCWKIMLYTFYLKTFGYTDPRSVDTWYWAALDKCNPITDKTNEEVLISKIKKTKEVFHKSVYGVNFDRGMHDREGFVSICRGLNRPMAKFLGVYDK